MTSLVAAAATTTTTTAVGACLSLLLLTCCVSTVLSQDDVVVVARVGDEVVLRFNFTDAEHVRWRKVSGRRSTILCDANSTDYVYSVNTSTPGSCNLVIRSAGFNVAGFYKATATNGSSTVKNVSYDVRVVSQLECTVALVPLVGANSDNDGIADTLHCRINSSTGVQLSPDSHCKLLESFDTDTGIVQHVLHCPLHEPLTFPLPVCAPDESGTLSCSHRPTTTTAAGTSSAPTVLTTSTQHGATTSSVTTTATTATSTSNTTPTPSLSTSPSTTPRLTTTTSRVQELTTEGQVPVVNVVGSLDASDTSKQTSTTFQTPTDLVQVIIIILIIIAALLSLLVIVACVNVVVVRRWVALPVVEHDEKEASCRLNEAKFCSTSPV